MNRRKFLKIFGSAIAGTGLSSWIFESLASSSAYSDAGLFSVPITETFANSICGICGCGCGIKVRLINGIPVRIFGNKVHPMNQHGLCAKGLAGLELLYHPDRLKAPMKRTGERGEGKWKEISWEEAFDELGSKLSKLAKSGMGDRIFFLTDRVSVPTEMIIKSFLARLKSSNYFYCSLIPNFQFQFELMNESSLEYAYDLENTNYILSFGEGILESEEAAAWYQRMYGEMRRGRAGKRVKIVHIDSRMGISGMHADEWVPINHNTQGIFALGIAHVLINENLVDDARLRQTVAGYEDWYDEQGNKHQGFKTRVLDNFTPDVVSRLTGVKTETLIRLSEEFATFKPSLAVPGERCNWTKDGVFSSLAIHALNILLGNVGNVGGIVAREKVPWPDIAEKRQPSTKQEFPFKRQSSQLDTRDWLSPDAFAEAIDRETDSPELLLVYRANPVYFAAQPGKLIDALKKIETIVSFSPFMDETSNFADFILPDHHFLEKWQAYSSPPMVSSVHVGLAKPVLKPLYQTMAFEDVLLKLMARIPGPKSTRSWTSYQQFLSFLFEKIYDSGLGFGFAERISKKWIEALQERGWGFKTYFSFDDFWNDVLERGGWGVPDFRKKDKGEKAISSSLIPVVERIPESDLKTSNESAKEPKHENKFPFKLSPYCLSTIGIGETAFSPMMMEIGGIYLKHRWDSWIELNPEDAKELGINDDELVWLITPRGRLVIKTRVFPGVKPGVINVPIGFGRTHTGRFSSQKGQSIFPVLELVKNTDLNSIAISETRARIAKI